jgi:uncharacterized Tic20 family protein
VSLTPFLTAAIAVWVLLLVARVRSSVVVETHGVRYRNYPSAERFVPFDAVDRFEPSAPKGVVLLTRDGNSVFIRALAKTPPQIATKLNTEMAQARRQVQTEGGAAARSGLSELFDARHDGETPSRRDRRIAALAHLGVPLCGPFLPLVVWVVSSGSRFRRDHASQAFSFQCAFFVFYAVAAVFVVAGSVSPVVLLIMLSLGALAEAPQVIRALFGHQALKIAPIQVLR